MVKKNSMSELANALLNAGISIDTQLISPITKFHIINPLHIRVKYGNRGKSISIIQLFIFEDSKPFEIYDWSYLFEDVERYETTQQVVKRIKRLTKSWLGKYRIRKLEKKEKKEMIETLWEQLNEDDFNVRFDSVTEIVSTQYYEVDALCTLRAWQKGSELTVAYGIGQAEQFKDVKSAFKWIQSKLRHDSLADRRIY